MNESLLLGCGNLGRIILDGFLSNNMKVKVYEKNQKVAILFSQKFLGKKKW